MNDNNLELYLKDLFDKECKYTTEEGEEDFIRDGVETIVRHLVSQTLPGYYAMIQNDDQDIFNRIRQDKGQFKSDGINCAECSKNDILKVGSYNEGTRNKFPDEFDFIFPVFCFEPSRELKNEDFDNLFTKIQKDILPPTQFVSGQKAKGIIRREDFSVYTSLDGRREIRLVSTPGIMGPARQLKFNMKKQGYGVCINETRSSILGERDIYVDIVSSVSVKGDFSSRCKFQPLCTLVKSIGKILIVRDSFTFTEAEVQFMSQVMSVHHRKVYRLLKFILNGNDEKAEEKGEYSSYMIKMYMIRHHSRSKCNDTSNLGQCIVNVLDDMCVYLKEEDQPTKSKALNINVRKHKSLALTLMEELIDKLKEVSNSKDVYNYKKISQQIPQPFIHCSSRDNPGRVFTNVFYKRC